MAGVLIKADRLGLQMAERWLWRELSFQVEPGQIVGVLGRNGTGKTTLMRALNGFAPLAEGELETVQPLGYVPQLTELSFPYCVRDVVAMGRARHIKLFSGLKACDEQAIDEAMKTVGITALEKRLFTQLSGGERQLTLIARALAAEARLLLLDEPMASLDIDNQHRILEMMGELAKGAGLGLLFVTHNPDHVFAVADKVLLLQGRDRTPAFGDVADVLSENALERLYGVPVRIIDLFHNDKSSRHAVPLF